MNQLKPFLFWIVIGTILVLELAYWLLSIPAIDLVGNKATAMTAKSALDTEHKHLVELDRRSRNASPMGVFDAEKASDIRRLTNDYLITPAWKDVLEPHVRRYDEQLKDIKEHLAARSKILHEPIAASSDKFGWYTAYQNLTEAQLNQLYEGKALVLPNSAGYSVGMGQKNLGAPPGSLAPRGASTGAGENKVNGRDFATDANLRAMAGFFTKGADLPEQAEHPVLTRNYRTMERIIAIVLATSATNAANPLAGQVDAPEAGRTAIAGVTWENKDRDAIIGGDTGTYAGGWKMILTLQGPLSAVLATTAAIERPTDSKAPVLVVTGSEISRKSPYAKGERKDVGAEMATCRLSLLVLDFSRNAGGEKPADGTAPQTGPAGFNGGVPPGMNMRHSGAPGGPPLGMPPPSATRGDSPEAEQ